MMAVKGIKFRCWSEGAGRYLSDDPRQPGGAEYQVHSDGSIESNCRVGPQGLTVEMFTGLKDAKGVEICEGDILTRRHERIEPLDMSFVKDLTGTGQIIVPNSMVYGREAFTETVLVAIPDIYTAEIDTEEFVVGGNVHQNPELLTSPKQIAR